MGGAYVLHSIGLRSDLESYTQRLGVSPDLLAHAYERLIEQGAIRERIKSGVIKVYLNWVDEEPVLEDDLERRLYVLFKSEIPCRFFPRPGVSLWATIKERMLRAWEQIYNIIINKIPLHWVRICWLRAGGMKIGKGSSVWRNTEIVGIENIVIGDDSVVGWHCQLDGRAGLIIGNHVSIGSYVLVIAGGHDPTTIDFTSFGEPIYIEDYAWLATRVMLLDGARIGRGAVLGAGTICSKPIEPYKIVSGNSAKPVGERPRDIEYTGVGGRNLYNFLH
jgi:acetyltransferase-like isoleucine patch superfamily enzyme